MFVYSKWNVVYMFVYSKWDTECVALSLVIHIEVRRLLKIIGLFCKRALQRDDILNVNGM